MSRNVVDSDTFTSSIDASWDNGVGGTHLGVWVTGGYVRPNSTSEAGYLMRNTGTYGADQYSRVTLQTLASGANELHAGVYSNTTDYQKYDAFLIGNPADVKYGIFKAAAGGSGNMLIQSDGTNGTSDIPGEAGTAGWILTLEVWDNGDGTRTLKLYTDEGSGDVLRLQVVDNGTIGGAVITSGRPMCGVYAPGSVSNAQLSAWEGGNLTTDQGGTVEKYRVTRIKA